MFQLNRVEFMSNLDNKVGKQTHIAIIKPQPFELHNLYLVVQELRQINFYDVIRFVCAAY